MATAAGGDGGEPTSSVQLQPSSNYASARKCKSFAVNCSLMAGGRQQSQLFQCRDLVGHIEGITAMEFSDDGSFLVSGCLDGAVRLWSISEDNDGTQLMETEHKSFVTSLAISSDNSSIFSTGFETAVFIHDTHTGKTLHTITHPRSVSNVTLQPCSTNGDVFASSSYDGILRLFDIRRSVTVPVLKTSVEDHGLCYSAAFSPVDSNVIASACDEWGIKLFDIRQDLFRCVHTFPSTNDDRMPMAKFNKKGTRLLSAALGQSPVVYDVPANKDSSIGNAVGSVRLSTQGYSNPNFIGYNFMCFAGKEDELVVSPSSNDHNLYVWSLMPKSQGSDLTVNQSVAVLCGHSDEVYTVRYDHNTDTLASAGEEQTIKLWTPSNR